MSKHVHNFYLDTELVETEDGPPQPRRSIFIECLDCDFVLRNNDIVKFFDFAFKLEPMKSAMEDAK